MKSKFIVGLMILAVSALFPISSLSRSEASTNKDNVVISADNTIVLMGEVTGESVGQVIAKAKELDLELGGMKEKYSSKRPLYLFLYSPGGSIQSGLELIEALKGLGRPVHTITMFSASMAFQIAQNLDDRLILKSGALMSHHAAGQFQGSFGGKATQMDRRYKFWLDRIKELDEQTVKRTNGKQTYESYTSEYDAEMWLTGTESVSEGYADRVVTVKCDKSLAGVTTQHANFLGMDVAYDLDKCPLNTSPMNVRINMPGSTVTLDQQTMDRVKAEFLAQYEGKQRQVIPMYW